MQHKLSTIQPRLAGRWYGRLDWVKLLARTTREDYDNADTLNANYSQEHAAAPRNLRSERPIIRQRCVNNNGLILEEAPLLCLFCLLRTLTIRWEERTLCHGRRANRHGVIWEDKLAGNLLLRLLRGQSMSDRLLVILEQGIAIKLVHLYTLLPHLA